MPDMTVLEPSWSTLTAMSDDRSSFQTGVVDGKIYALGGYSTSDGYLSSAEMYNPDTDTWTTLASMAATRRSFRTEVIDGKIYVIGGFGAGSAFLSSTEGYDPDTDTWTALSSMSTPRHNFQTEVIEGKIYAIGGLGAGNVCLSSAEVYDPGTDTWTVLSSMSTARHYFRTEVIDGKIYAIGGRDTSSGSGISLSSAEVYDPGTDVWTALPSMLGARWGMGTAVVDEKIYVMGGYDSINTVSLVEVYDPDSNTWTAATSMPIAKSWFGTAIAGGKIYVIGGRGDADTNPDSYLSSFEVYDPETNAWTTLPSMAVRRQEIPTEIIDRTIYAFGGANPASLSSVESYVVPSYDNALLRVTMVTGEIKEYEMPFSDVNAFLSWINSEGTENPVYTIGKDCNLGPFSGRDEYLIYDKISSFEVLQY